MASEVFLIFSTQLYQCFSVLFLFTLFSDEPEVFLPKYSQTAILHAAHLRRVVKLCLSKRASKLLYTCEWKHSITVFSQGVQ